MFFKTVGIFSDLIFRTRIVKKHQIRTKTLHLISNNPILLYV
ncbi:hypothetical protein BG20_I0386 [Candidatus Nitrosarchaeum limnium BG20]|uniref:Uncharacterized protein n=1 Tax=Candidatus Nitrosarchaeum limnium BG20 TaxID=859192 RepID=S2E1A1_9ARCH|nr:hypothetical protein BG20_I0386 [Candidatus Nitrosarchaeum limnium BG20]